MAEPSVLIQGQVFKAGDLFDKTLYSFNRNNVRSSPEITNDNIVFTSSPGQFVGTIYSWVTRGNYIWWMLYPTKSWGKYTYVRHDNNSFSLKAIQGQNVKTEKEKEKEKEEKEKTWTEKLQDWLSPTGNIIKYGVPIFIIGVGLVIIWKVADKPKFQRLKKA